MSDNETLQHYIARLTHEQSLPPDALRMLLAEPGRQVTEWLACQARHVARRQFGRGIYVRGLIEISNYCRNNCRYCGIRAGNPEITRYRLTQAEILSCCALGYTQGFRTFVLQGGEDPRQTDDFISDTVSLIHRRYPDCAITLSLGEKSRHAYEQFFQAGATRYLLRHETYNATHYHYLHPAEMSERNRLRCLTDLKEIGYQVGTGIMVGSPGQTLDHLIEDISFIARFRPQMIGIGPFIPHHSTPFAHEKPGSLDLTLRLLAIFRLMHPAALIPATTALATLSPQGRLAGIQAGANVVMPNLSPPARRDQYELYDAKAAHGAEAAEGLALLKQSLDTIGYSIHPGRGDYASPCQEQGNDTDIQEKKESK